MGSVGLSKYLAAAMALLAALLVPAAAIAHPSGEPSFAPTCHASTDAEVGFPTMIERGSWNCDEYVDDAGNPVSWLRFESDAWNADEPPRYFFTRIARFESIAFAAIDVDGDRRIERYDAADAEPFAAGPVFELKLPQITRDTRAVLVRIDRPHSVPMLTEARLTRLSKDADWSQTDMMLLSLVLGMLVLPLFFDISFFVVLREKFVAYHAAMVISMIAYTLLGSGLISAFVILPLDVIAIGAPLSWAIGCGLALLFFAAFIEPWAQSRLMRRMTVLVGIWTMAVPGFFALQLHATQPIDDAGYYLTFLPAIATLPLCIVGALWRGSLAARFLAVAWLPVFLAGIERSMRGMGVYVASSTNDQIIYLAIAIEVIVISLAVGSRLLAFRRERDAAVNESQMLERLSARDPLTGLMNRRAIEDRFADLRQQGFHTFAVLDLDKFKDINDRFGHQAGDRALIACAEAIRGGEERDIVAVRLGGEEFVILLRGADARQRAEKLRQAVPVRIAREVEELDRVVTASMGLLELAQDTNAMMSFDELYARADKLLYEAKAGGRDRTNYERLEVFHRPPAPRPRIVPSAAA